MKKIFYIHIYSNNCKWDLYINDIIANFNEESTVINTTLGINQYLLESGDQSIKIKIHPKEGQLFLDLYTSFKLTLSSEDNDSGEEKIELSYVIPEQNGKSPLLEFNNTFKANFEYNLSLKNFSEIKITNDLMSKVKSQFETLINSINSDNEKEYIEIYKNFLDRRHTTYFSTNEERQRDLMKESLTEFKKEIFDIEFLPIQSNSKLILFHQNKIVALEQINPITKKKFYGIAYRAKFKNDNSICQGTLNLMFCEQKNNNQLVTF
ncbi:hypothetical protein [Flavobacterium oreochromis]|uniref:Uncharacterized protein n=1 Tax=Flavobacterium columnare TaxID=996 RepID=A0A246G717_9FLAO|nr:hypothetical protein [Flavobacterium oreochromis]OWP74080.1 hypothetical protein BWK62_15100 [Flavobacterium oreochromis]